MTPGKYESIRGAVALLASELLCPVRRHCQWWCRPRRNSTTCDLILISLLSLRYLIESLAQPSTRGLARVV